MELTKKNYFYIPFIIKYLKKKNINTSWSLGTLGVFGAGDVGSGVLAPLDSARLSVRRFARDRVLQGNFINV